MSKEILNKNDAWEHTLKTEWFVEGGDTIMTKDAFYGFREYKSSGGLKKNAKKLRQQILYHYSGNAEFVLKQICFEHNCFINRNNKDSQLKMLEEAIRAETYKLRFWLESIAPAAPERSNP